jgi:hypothetical protein
MAQSKFSQDSLIQGIEAIISKNRSSFSDDEINVLQQCVEELRNYKATKDKKDLEKFVLKVLTEFVKPEVVKLIIDWIREWLQS